MLPSYLHRDMYTFPVVHKMMKCQSTTGILTLDVLHLMQTAYMLTCAALQAIVLLKCSRKIPSLIVSIAVGSSSSSSDICNSANADKLINSLELDLHMCLDNIRVHGA